ncbi:MAG: tRNA adenosine(34) deaminase TadA [Gemmatimonadales bacterium]|jgi:tRNA(adenine34) deaminase
MSEADARWMAIALDEASNGGSQGEVPVGAAVVSGGALVARNHNRTRQLADPTAHAEILALREAAEKVGDWRLTDCTLYVTLEPCAMCAGAIVLARISRLVFAADDPKAGMCGSLENLVQDPRLNHRVSVTGGLMADQSAELLRDFFKERR